MMYVHYKLWLHYDFLIRNVIKIAYVDVFGSLAVENITFNATQMNEWLE